MFKMIAFGRCHMIRRSPRSTMIVRYLILGITALMWIGNATAEQPAEPQGELRIVDKRLWGGSWSIAQSVVERLVDIDHNGKLAPRLATGWRWIDDLTLELTLRQGVRFHNGEVFNAEIVKRNWDALTALREHFGAGLIRFAFHPKARLDVIDPYTVRLVLPEVDAATLVKLANYSMTNQQFYRTMRHPWRYWGTLYRPGPWGTGPYRWVKGSLRGLEGTGKVILEANPNYWDSARLPQVKRIVFEYALESLDAARHVNVDARRADLFADLRPLDTLRIARSQTRKVVKERGGLRNVMGFFNMRKAKSPWRDRRLRQAVNHAINRPHLIRYAAKGNGIAVPSLLPPGAFGYDPRLKPYDFDTPRAKYLLQQSGYVSGLSLNLIAPRELEVQATVVSKMLEQAGFTVRMTLFDRLTFQWHINLYHVSSQARAMPTWSFVEERHTWDIALMTTFTAGSLAAVFPTPAYVGYALDGVYDWVVEQPEFRTLYNQLIRTRERDQQEALIHQIETHIRDEAYFVFLYNLIQLYAVNKEVEFVPHPSGLISLATTSVTGQHWSVRRHEVSNSVPKQAASPLQSRLAQNYHLQRPEGEGPFPAVILLSSCSGFAWSPIVHGHTQKHVRALLAQGYVILFVDFIGARDLHSCRQKLLRQDVARDLLIAVDHLKTLPFVKASAINVIGWTFGGESALTALRVADAADLASIHAIVSYHPACHQVKPWTANVPVLILTGALNDVNPPAACHALREQLPEVTPVALHVFPEARHMFDLQGLPSRQDIGKGRTMGYHLESAVAAWQAVETFLKR